MTIKIYKARIKLLGDSLSVTSASHGQNIYSYIELDTGEIIRRFKTLMGLDGQVHSSLKVGETVELHVNEILSGVPDPGSVLLAIRREDGKLFASHVPEMPFLYKVLPLLMFFVGLFTLWIFGLGLVCWWIGWRMHKATKQVVEAADYIKSLNGAILI